MHIKIYLQNFFRVCMICYKPCFENEYFLLHVYSYEHYNKFFNLNFHSRKYCTLFEIQGVKVYKYKKT